MRSCHGFDLGVALGREGGTLVLSANSLGDLRLLHRTIVIKLRFQDILIQIRRYLYEISILDCFFLGNRNTIRESSLALSVHVIVKLLLKLHRIIVTLVNPLQLPHNLRTHTATLIRRAIIHPHRHPLHPLFLLQKPLFFTGTLQQIIIDWHTMFLPFEVCQPRRLRIRGLLPLLSVPLLILLVSLLSLSFTYTDHRYVFRVIASEIVGQAALFLAIIIALIWLCQQSGLDGHGLPFLILKVILLDV